MEHSHAWLGMGEMPAGAVVDFTIRQSAFFYGMHGVLMWTLARDVVRYQPVVRLIGWTYVLFGPVFLAIDWSSGTPAWWTACDPLVCFVFGWLVLWCVRNMSQQSPQSAGSSQAAPRAVVPAGTIPNRDSA